MNDAVKNPKETSKNIKCKFCMEVLYHYLNTFCETEGRDDFGGSFEGRGMGTCFSSAGIMAYVKIKRDISNTRYFEPGGAIPKTNEI